MFLHLQEAQGLTYAQVAKATGLGRSHIHQFQKTAEIGEPKFGFMTVLAQFYGLTPNDVARELGILEDAPKVPHAAEDIRVMAALRRLDKLPAALKDRAVDIITGQIAALEALIRDQA